MDPVFASTTSDVLATSEDDVVYKMHNYVSNKYGINQDSTVNQ